MPQFTIPVRFYVEYFYDRTNISELKRKLKRHQTFISIQYMT